MHSISPFNPLVTLNHTGLQGSVTPKKKVKIFPNDTPANRDPRVTLPYNSPWVKKGPINPDSPARGDYFFEAMITLLQRLCLRSSLKIASGIKHYPR